MTDTVVAPSPAQTGRGRRFGLGRRKGDNTPADPSSASSHGGDDSQPVDPPKETAGWATRVDLRNTWQIVAGSILVPLGIVFILMAWYGSAHTHYVQQQIPYLVSGSFAGLGCLILGGLLYWAHWLYRMYDQADQHHEERMRAMEEQTRILVEQLSAAGGVRAIGGPSPSTMATTARPYVATATGTVYHLSNCVIVSSHTEGLRSLGPEDLAGMGPCRLCIDQTR
jgi:hypothetical protein